MWRLGASGLIYSHTLHKMAVGGRYAREAEVPEPGVELLLNRLLGSSSSPRFIFMDFLFLFEKLQL